MTRDELKEIIKECIEEINMVQHVDEDYDAFIERIEAENEDASSNAESINEDSEMELVEEGFFLSADGKSFKKEVLSFLASKSSKATFKETLTFNLNKVIEWSNEIVRALESKFSNLYSSNLIEVTHTNSNGTYTTYETRHIIIYKNNVYMFAVSYYCKRAGGFAFKEIKTNNPKFKIPLDAIKYAIDKCNPHYILTVTNNTIKTAGIGNWFNRHNKELYEEIHKKYPDNSKIGMFGLKFF